MHPTWILADSDGGIIPFIVIVVMIAINMIRLATQPLQTAAGGAPARGRAAAEPARNGGRPEPARNR